MPSLDGTDTVDSRTASLDRMDKGEAETALDEEEEFDWERAKKKTATVQYDDHCYYDSYFHRYFVASYFSFVALLVEHHSSETMRRSAALYHCRSNHHSTTMRTTRTAMMVWMSASLYLVRAMKLSTKMTRLRLRLYWRRSVSRMLPPPLRLLQRLPVVRVGPCACDLCCRSMARCSSQAWMRHQDGGDYCSTPVSPCRHPSHRRCGRASSSLFSFRSHRYRSDSPPSSSSPSGPSSHVASPRAPSRSVRPRVPLRSTSTCEFDSLADERPRSSYRACRQSDEK